VTNCQATGELSKRWQQMLPQCLTRGELDCSHHAQNARAVCELNVVFFACQSVCVLSFLSHELVVLFLCGIQNAMLMRMRHLKLTVAVSVLRSDSTDAGMKHVGGCAFSMLL
jgi:hypothetical protein